MGLLRQFSENDARAAMKVWVETLARERGVQADPSVKIFDSYAAIETALQEQAVDGVTLPTDQFWAYGGSNYFNRALFPARGGSMTDEYVLLVRRNGGLTNLANLQGRSLAIYAHSIMSLARPWLETELLQNGLPPIARCFAGTNEFSKLTKVVLPVFFGQLDACLVDQQGFRVMAELNPQVGTQLRVLACSKPLIPVAFYFRSGYPAQPQDQVVNELARLHLTPAGQQVLTVFQTERLVELPLSCLNDSIQLLKEHRRLCQGTNALVSAATPDRGAETAGGGK